jgi:hypothetical protein
VIVPSCGGIRVQNDGGRVALHNVTGAIEVHTSLNANDGNAIYIETGSPLTDPVLLRSQRGDIEVRMGRGSSGQMTATSQHGSVTVDAGHATVKSVKGTKTAWAGNINAGASDQRIDAEYGDVLVRLAL